LRAIRSYVVNNSQSPKAYGKKLQYQKYILIYVHRLSKQFRFDACLGNIVRDVYRNIPTLM